MAYGLYSAVYDNRIDDALEIKDRCSQYILTGKTDGVTDWLIDMVWEINPWALPKNDLQGIFEYIFLMACSDLKVTILGESYEKTDKWEAESPYSASGLGLVIEMFKGCTGNNCSEVFPNVSYIPADIRQTSINLIPVMLKSHSYFNITTEYFTQMLKRVYFPTLRGEDNIKTELSIEDNAISMAKATREIWKVSPLSKREDFDEVFIEMIEINPLIHDDKLSQLFAITMLNVVNGLCHISIQSMTEEDQIIVSVGGAAHQIAISLMLQEFNYKDGNLDS